MSMIDADRILSVTSSINEDQDSDEREEEREGGRERERERDVLRKEGREERVRVSRKKDGDLMKKNKRLVFTHSKTRAVNSLLK